MQHKRLADRRGVNFGQTFGLENYLICFEKDLKNYQLGANEFRFESTAEKIIYIYFLIM